ncbi:MAG TPA: pyridoxal phosphate-dependent aminotransferase [Thermoanaerobaculia bacterium]|nr:pyridoxal phosphate-dependent aminotransferase [Thermoanaerobaculia bacterium]
MPRFPVTSSTIAALPGAVYSSLAQRLADFRGETYPLHIGDTWREPPVGCRMQDLHVEEHPGMHRYGPTQGLPALLEALSKRVSSRTGVATASDDLLITAGATGGLAVAVGALVEPGDEVLILAPYWPLIAGIVSTFGACPVPVPLLDSARGIEETASPEAVIERIEGATSAKSVALYVNTPNNPTGRLLPRPWLEAIAVWARQRDLWLLSDEVYEDLIYDGEHQPMRPLASERTISAHSFSKAYGMAGNRCGYLVAPPPIIAEMKKVGTHTYYAAPTAAQLAALEALGPAGDTWLGEARREYAKAGESAARRLGAAAPRGSTFLFLDVESALDERGLVGFLEDLVGEGLLVSPGPSFGPFPTHVRVCFTAAPPDVVERGIEILARRLGR